MQGMHHVCFMLTRGPSELPPLPQACITEWALQVLLSELTFAIAELVLLSTLCVCAVPRVLQGMAKTQQLLVTNFSHQVTDIGEITLIKFFQHYKL